MSINQSAEVDVKVNGEDARKKLEELKGQARSYRKLLTEKANIGDLAGADKVRRDLKEVERQIRTMRREAFNINEVIKLNFDLKILLSVNEVSSTLKNVLQNHKKCDTIIIVIGPEGGFKKEEEDVFIENGFLSTSLGNRVLRTETASITALSMLNYEYER